MNSFFEWLKDSSTQGVLVLVGTIAACIAAIGTIFFGRKSLTKKDIARVEQNTEHLEEVRINIASMDLGLKKQQEVERLHIRASRVSITATGNQAGNVPYQVCLSIKNSEKENILLTHVELYNEQGNSFGSFPCSRAANPNSLEFHALIPSGNMGDWFRGGSPVQTVDRMRLKFRLWLSIDGVEVSRDMAVIVSITNVIGGHTQQGYILNGSV